MSTRHWLLLALVVVAAPLAGSEPLKLRLSQPAAAAPANLLVQVSVEPDSDNRSLEVVIDSGEYYRGSEVALDGQEARRTHSFEFRHLPTGTYEIRAVLAGVGGNPRAFADGRVIVY